MNESAEAMPEGGEAGAAELFAFGMIDMPGTKPAKVLAELRSGKDEQIELEVIQERAKLDVHQHSFLLTLLPSFQLVVEYWTSLMKRW